MTCVLIFLDKFWLIINLYENDSTNARHSEYGLKIWILSWNFSADSQHFHFISIWLDIFWIFWIVSSLNLTVGSFTNHDQYTHDKQLSWFFFISYSVVSSYIYYNKNKSWACKYFYNYKFGYMYILIYTNMGMKFKV